MKNILYIGNRLNHKNVTVTSVDTLGELLKREGYTVTTSSAKKNQAIRLLDMCFSVIKKRKTVDVVLIDTYSTLNFHYAVTVAWLCRFFSIDYILLLHGGNLPERLYKSSKLSKPLFSKAKINVAPSQYLMQAFLEAGYSNLVYIPNTINIGDYPYKQRKSLQPKLLWVRSFAEIYNPQLALEVLEILLLKYPHVSLTMVGPEKDGTLQLCKQKAQSQNLPVIFTGKLEKKEWIDLSREFDIFINTTNFDNTPVSVIEAMALGLVIVSTNVGGIPYLLEDSQEALLTDPGNAFQMAEKIEYIIEDNDLSIRLGNNARKKAETFDWYKVKNLWNNILN